MLGKNKGNDDYEKNWKFKQTKINILLNKNSRIVTVRRSTTSFEQLAENYYPGMNNV